MRRGAFSRLLAAGAMLLVVTVSASTTPAQTIEVFKSASCGCCTLWLRHLVRSGFSPKWKDLSSAELTRIKTDAGLPSDLQSCHTARIGGYVVEGHVPAADIRRLLAERPDAVGLSVPGMPIGSPGMEAGNEREPYDVLLVRRDGTTEVFSSH